MESFLETIRRLKIEEIRDRQQKRPLRELAASARDTDPPKNFAGALGGQEISIIAEVKRSSPSAGKIAPKINPLRQAQAYREGGAAAISVLTEAAYFGGSLADLHQISSQLDIPVLRKDFIIHPYQICEARAAGADAVLLISDLLSFEELSLLLSESAAWGIATLVEAHDQISLEQAQSVGARVIGINNRNLKSLKVETKTALNLLPQLDEELIKVAESGLKTRQDVLAAQQAGADAVLIGEALMRSDNPVEMIRKLAGKTG